MCSMYQAAEASRLFINGPIRVIVKLSNSAVFISFLVLIAAKLWKHPTNRRLRCAWCLIVTGSCAQFGWPLVFVRLSSMAILAVLSPIPFSPLSLLLH